MSIINEALKKAAREKNKTVSEEPAYSNIASAAYKPKLEQKQKPDASKDEVGKSEFPLEPIPTETKKSNTLMWILMGVLVSAAIMSISLIITGINKKTVKPLATPSIATPEKTKETPLPINLPPPLSTQTETTATSVSEAPKVKIPASPPSLMLSGIVAGGDGSFAIIDGLVVKKGDTVSGAKVLGIYADKVVLEYDGAEFSIRSH